MLIAAGSVYQEVDTRPPNATIAKKLARKMLQRCELAGSPQCMPSPVTRNGHGFDRITEQENLADLEPKAVKLLAGGRPALDHICLL
jgi:hypothetical protein